jgi:hypothetical protein
VEEYASDVAPLCMKKLRLPASRENQQPSQSRAAGAEKGRVPVQGVAGRAETQKYIARGTALTGHYLLCVADRESMT